MKTLNITVALAVLVCLAAASAVDAMQAQVDFSGRWVLELAPTPSVPTELVVRQASGPDSLPRQISVTRQGSSGTVTETWHVGTIGGTVPGSGGGPRTFRRVTWKDSTLIIDVETIRAQTGDRTPSELRRELWSLTPEGKLQVVVTESGPSRTSPPHALVYRKVHEGAGLQPTTLLPGIETFLADVPQSLRGKRVGLITNHSGIDRFGVSGIDLIAKHRDLKLVALLAPEHGIRGTVEAGEKVVDETDARTGVPIYSLYLSEDRGPTPEMLKDVDVLVYDLQEVGGRTWTYVSTMALSMQAAVKKGIPFVVLDRPNPIGGEIVEGALLDPKFKSFVGMYPIPARHGMTVGELATLFNQKYGIGANLIVARVANWQRSQWLDQTGLPWVNPSPNLRSLAALTSYPGSVYIEGTNLSEGRGTDRPFEQIGAPWLNAPAVAKAMNEMRLPGIRFEAITMTIAPTAAKHKGLTVPAIRFVITDRQVYRPVTMSLLLIDEIRRQHPGDFAWTATIDRLTGSDKVKLAIEGGRLRQLLQEWDREADAFREDRKPYLLYR